MEKLNENERKNSNKFQHTKKTLLKTLGLIVSGRSIKENITVFDNEQCEK